MAFRVWKRTALLGSLACALAQAASAQLYVCTTAQGKTISADRPPPECADRPIRELRADGSTRRVIEPPLSEEQKAQREAERKLRAEQALRVREQLRKDRALLEAYSSEAEIEDARDRQLAQRNQTIKIAEKRLQEHLTAREKLNHEKEFYQNKALPDKLQKAFEASDAVIRAEEKIIAALKADIVRINERFDEDRRRYKEIIEAGARPIKRLP